MKKLFLTSFVFTTGGNEYKEQRLVVAKDKDEAYEKALAWYFPESRMISCITHEVIGGEGDGERTNIPDFKFTPPPPPKPKEREVEYYQKKYLLLDFCEYLWKLDEPEKSIVSVVDNYLKSRAI